ncbi:hypothetical protein N7494_000541 [Penicillium frequentans]|uniref:Myb-like domain-containing protein n=1 Tax=Penicillium frequentans TaxID=3151616 RepID=A0AAD6D695_9EURO|nr:hypothetical protein N7494_000541 [Penicillium glabrum]
MLQALQEPRQAADGDSARSESPTPPVEIQMCDIDEVSNPALDFEMTIDKDMDDDFRDRQASITPTSQETLTENTFKAPLKLISAWSPSEKRQLRDFLSTRGHLSWSRIALEYEAEYHKGRSASSIAGQARCLGLSVGRKPSKKPTSTVRRDPLVLKVRVPQIDKFSSFEEATSAGPAHIPTTPCSEEANPFPNSPPSHHLQDCSSPPVEFHTIRPRLLDHQSASEASRSAETPNATTIQVYTTAPSQHSKVIQLPVSHTDNNPHEINFGSTAVLCFSNSASSEITSETSDYRTLPSLSPSHAHVAIIRNGSMF